MATGETISHTAMVSCTGHVQLNFNDFKQLENVYRSVYSEIVKRREKLLRIHPRFI